MVNNAVMQFVDRAFLAGHSMEAFQAVLPASALSWIFLGFFQAVAAYSGVFVAQYHGAKNPRMCGVSYGAATLIAFGSGALVAALAPVFADGTRDEAAVVVNDGLIAGNVFTSMCIALAIGLAFGIVQGFLVAYLEFQPFIVTLAGLFFASRSISAVLPLISAKAKTGALHSK